MGDVTGYQHEAADDRDLEPRLGLYAALFAKLNQEGDGIWNRFNVLAGINLALFGAFAYVCLAERRPPVWREGGFPDRPGWVKPHEELSRRQKTDLGILRTWMPYFTQPFFVLFAIAWGVLLLVLVLRPAASLVRL